MRGKSITVPIMVLIMFICLSFTTYAHSGRVDSNVGHYRYETTLKAATANNINNDTVRVTEKYYLTYTEKAVIKSIAIIVSIVACGFVVYKVRHIR